MKTVRIDDHTSALLDEIRSILDHELAENGLPMIKNMHDLLKKVIMDAKTAYDATGTAIALTRALRIRILREDLKKGSEQRRGEEREESVREEKEEERKVFKTFESCFTKKTSSYSGASDDRSKPATELPNEPPTINVPSATQKRATRAKTAKRSHDLEDDDLQKIAARIARRAEIPASEAVTKVRSVAKEIAEDDDLLCPFPLLTASQVLLELPSGNDGSRMIRQAGDWIRAKKVVRKNGHAFLVNWAKKTDPIKELTRSRGHVTYPIVQHGLAPHVQKAIDDSGWAKYLGDKTGDQG